MKRSCSAFCRALREPSYPVAIQQSSPRQPGGVILLGRDYEGTELRWTSKLQPGATTLTLVGGIAYDVLAEHRQGFQNFTGSTLGVRGAARRAATRSTTCLASTSMRKRRGSSRRSGR